MNPFRISEKIQTLDRVLFIVKPTVEEPKTTLWILRFALLPQKQVLSLQGGRNPGLLVECAVFFAPFERLRAASLRPGTRLNIDDAARNRRALGIFGPDFGNLEFHMGLRRIGYTPEKRLNRAPTCRIGGPEGVQSGSELG